MLTIGRTCNCLQVHKAARCDCCIRRSREWQRSRISLGSWAIEDQKLASVVLITFASPGCCISSPWNTWAWWKSWLTNSTKVMHKASWVPRVHAHTSIHTQIRTNTHVHKHDHKQTNSHMKMNKKHTHTRHGSDLVGRRRRRWAGRYLKRQNGITA